MTGERAIRMSSTEFVVFLATISAMTALGIDLIVPAFGAIRETFGLAENSTSVGLTVTTYFLGLSLGQIIYGPLADRFGRKPVLLVGLGLYGLAAVAGGLAPNLTTLLVVRLLWGLGAAGPRVLLLAIARDVHDGDRLGKVLSTAAAIFMVVPAIAPLAGQGILSLAGWRVVVAAPVVVAAGLIAWTALRLDETAAWARQTAEQAGDQQPIERPPLNFAATGRAVRAVMSDRVALGYALALLCDFAAFASFLASTELLFDQVYDRSSQFPLVFGLMSGFMGLSALTSSRLVGRLGAKKMIRWALAGAVLSSAMLLAAALVGDGRPNFWLWFGLLTLSNSMRVVVNPLASSEAMQSMGDLAGTAASVIGTISMGGGAILAGITDRFIDASVTPLASAYLFYGLLEVAAVLFATGLILAPKGGQKGRAEAYNAR